MAKTWISFFAKLFCPNYMEIAKTRNKLQLVTIAISHYVEYAKFALIIGKIPFDEHGYAPGQHVLPTISVRLDNNGKNYLSSTSCMQAAKTNQTLDRPVKRGSPTSVPVGILPNGDIITDSWDIANYSGLKPIDNDLKVLLDEKLCPLARQRTYYFLLKPKNIHRIGLTVNANRNFIWRFFWWLFVENFILSALK